MRKSYYGSVLATIIPAGGGDETEYAGMMNTAECRSRKAAAELTRRMRSDLIGRGFNVFGEKIYSTNAHGVWHWNGIGRFYNAKGYPISDILANSDHRKTNGKRHGSDLPCLLPF